MATWTNRPSEESNDLPFRIHRTPANRPIKGIILSTHLVGTMLHYFRGRSRPCGKNNCEACESGQKPRWKGYIELKPSDGKTVQIVEITERVFPQLDAEEKKNGNIRGVKIELSRLKPRANAPLHLEIKAGRIADCDLPKEHDLKAILERMWEVKQKMLNETEEPEEPQVLPIQQKA